MRSALKTFGMSGLLDDLETRLNRAAEDATPKAKEVFLGAIDDMSLDGATTFMKALTTPRRGISKARCQTR